ncbi:MAG: flagellar protein FlaG [Thermoanaerobacteraceae bacterium]|nr:flagellar protein FlaG [Thermoanaerobacteraceae bacterium]
MQVSTAVQLQLPEQVRHNTGRFHEAAGQKEKPQVNAEQQNNNDKRNIGEEQIIAAVERVNEAFDMHLTRFEFSIHEATREIVVKVKDAETGEVIREIPPEKILDMVAKMWELAGLIVDEKV